MNQMTPNSVFYRGLLWFSFFYCYLIEFFCLLKQKESGLEADKSAATGQQKVLEPVMTTGVQMLKVLLS